MGRRSEPPRVRNRSSMILALLVLVAALVWLNIAHNEEVVYYADGQLVPDITQSINQSDVVLSPGQAVGGKIYTRRRYYGWPVRAFGVSDAVVARSSAWIPHSSSVNIYFWKAEPSAERAKWALAFDMVLLGGLPVLFACAWQHVVDRRNRAEKQHGSAASQTRVES